MPPPEFVTLSVSPSTTFSYLLRFIGYVVVFLFVREITRRAREEWRWILFIPLVMIGVLEAAIGLSQNAEAAEVVSGTYGNRNHFAGLLEMILPGTIACGIALVKGDGFRSPSILHTLSGSAMFVAATSIFVAIVYSQSKMGFVATLVGLLAMGIVALGSGLPVRRKWIGVAGLAAILLGVFIFFPSGQTIEGFGNAFADDSTAEGRLPIAADTLHLIADFPIFGSGLGTYASAFAKYQSGNSDVGFDYAHNDYLQLLAELGIVGFSLLTLCIVAIVTKVYRIATYELDSTHRLLGLGCFAGMLAMALHSLVDFNLYMPANAMVLVWIAGIATGLPSASNVRSQKTTWRIPLKPVVLALCCVLLVFSIGWLIFGAKFSTDAQAERHFCRFGICDIDSVLAAQPGVAGGSFAGAPQPLLIEAVRRDPSAPGRWSDLGQALAARGQIEQARKCFANALRLGPNVPPLLLTAAKVYEKTGDHANALKIVARALSHTEVYRTIVFDWLASAKIPVDQVLAQVLPPDPQAFRSYLANQMQSENPIGAAETWKAANDHGYMDEQSALAYANWLYSRKEYQVAALTWASYLGDRGKGYLKSNRILNGDFESGVSKSVFDWSIGELDGVEVERDAAVKHTGSYSLRIQLTGKENLTSVPVSLRAAVTPGRYH
ncbi:MAG: O-antigen ligase family protein, partial [Acidobacteriota bacterium]